MSEKTNARNVAIFNGIATGLGWAGFGIGISAITSLFWIRQNGDRSGLWQLCRDSTTGACENLPDEAWLNAVRAFMILYIIFMLFGNFANIASQVKKDKKVRSSSGVIWSIAATFGLVGMAVYTATINQRYNASTYFYGYGFGAGWGLVGGGYLAFLFNQISAGLMPDRSDRDCGNKNSGEEKF